MRREFRLGCDCYGNAVRFKTVASHGGEQDHDMKILAGNSNRPLTEAIAAYLGLPLTKCQVRRFADM